MTDAIVVGQKRQIYKPSTNELFCIDITAENFGSIQRYDNQKKTDADWRFGDQCSGDNSVPTATISFTEDNGLLKIDVVPLDEEVLAWQRQMTGQGRRSRKVKKSKPSKKRSARRRRSSKARKARKARSTRRR
jgi:hypothetical protein